MAETPAPPKSDSLIAQLSDANYQSLVLPDGRNLAYATYGAALQDAQHPPLFYFHGHPGSRLECGLLDRAGREQGFHLIAVDRPGMGRSSAQAQRRLLDWPGDVLALADHLGLGRFAVLGVSGGGPYALACLRAIPAARLVAASVVSSAFSTRRFGTAGMLLLGKALFWSATWSTTLVGVLLDWVAGRACRDEADPDALYRSVRAQLSGKDRPEVDLKAFKEILDDPDMCRLLVESLREALRFGSDGAAWEVWLIASDWGFDLESVEDAHRLSIWHGALDINVPVAMADGAARLLQGAEYKRFDSEGHFSLSFHHRDEILRDLGTRMS